LVIAAFTKIIFDDNTKLYKVIEIFVSKGLIQDREVMLINLIGKFKDK